MNDTVALRPASQPRTKAGREFAKRIAHFQILGDIGSILAIEAEAAAPTPARESEALDVLREMLAGGVVIDIPGKYVEMQHDHRTLERARALLRGRR